MSYALFAEAADTLAREEKLEWGGILASLITELILVLLIVFVTCARRLFHQMSLEREQHEANQNARIEALTVTTVEAFRNVQMAQKEIIEAVREVDAKINRTREDVANNTAELRRGNDAIKRNQRESSINAGLARADDTLGSSTLLKLSGSNTSDVRSNSGSAKNIGVVNDFKAGLADAILDS